MRWILLVTLLLFGGYGDRSDDVPLLTYQASHSVEPGAIWVRLLKRHPELALARLASSDDHYWLSVAAKGGNDIAQYHLAEHPATSDSQRRYWLQRSALQGNLAAQQQLAAQLAGRDPQQARFWLAKAAKVSSKSAMALAEQQFQSQQISALSSTLVHAQQLGARLAQPTRQALSRLTLHSFTSQCRQRLLLIVSDLAGLRQANQLMGQFAGDQRLASLPICISGVKYIPASKLSCDGNWLQQGRLGCNELVLARQLARGNFTHLVVLATAGKANVNDGIMYLDRQDTYGVFVHELAHFAGLVDEYPLTKPLLHQFCLKGGLWPNLLVVKNGVVPTVPAAWQGQTKQLYKAHTCDNSPFQAYKPARGLTFMEFYDTGNIPSVYLQQWRQQLLRKPLIPAYVNLLQAAQQSGYNSLEQLWQQRLSHYYSRIGV